MTRRAEVRNPTLLLLPVVGALPIEGRFPALPILVLGAPFDGATGQFETGVGRHLSLRVAALQVAFPPRPVAIHRFNVVAWPAPDAGCPVFLTGFRDDPDRPDATILAAGHARFEPAPTFELPPLDGVYPRRADPFPLEGTTVTGFEMVFPSRIDLVKPGGYSIEISLTLRVGEGAEAVLETFRIDPEMNVQGSYPP